MADRTEDEVVDALDRAAQALDDNRTRINLALERIAEIVELRLSGMTYAEIAQREQRPFLVELLTMNLAALQGAGNMLRTVTARALRDEGLTMDRIAELFGVSRQRVSALLRPTPRDEPPSSP